jgi:hypothetical protein
VLVVRPYNGDASIGEVLQQGLGHVRVATVKASQVRLGKVGVDVAKQLARSRCCVVVAMTREVFAYPPSLVHFRLIKLFTSSDAVQDRLP